MTIKRALYNAHKWLGLAVLLFLLIQVLTGLVLVLRDALTAVDSPVRQGDPARVISLAELAARARTVEPNHRLTRLIFPRDAEELVLARYQAPDGGLSFAALDRSTGAEIRSGGMAKFPAEAALFIHGDLLLGTFGVWIVRFVSVAFVLLAISGAVLGWPGLRRLGRALRIRLSGRFLPLVFTMHRSLGLIFSALLLVVGVTGTILSWRAVVEPPKVSVPHELPSYPLERGQVDAGLDQLVQEVSDAVKNPPLRDISFGTSQRIYLTFYAETNSNPRATHKAEVDLASGELTFFHPTWARSTPTSMLDWALPVHSGQALGVAGRVVSFATGLVLIVLIFTGLFVWLSKSMLARKR